MGLHLQYFFFFFFFFLKKFGILKEMLIDVMTYAFSYDFLEI